MPQKRLPAFRVRAHIRDEPLWSHLADAPLSVRMALEEAGGQAAEAEAVRDWLSERLHCYVDLASLGVDADEAIHGAVRLSVTAVSLGTYDSGDVAVFNATAEATIRVRSGLDDRRAAESALTHIGSGTVQLSWREVTQADGTGWLASRARVEFDRYVKADCEGHEDELTPEQWFTESDSSGASRRRRVRLAITASRVHLEAALDRHHLPRELRGGCPWQGGASDDIDVELARKWLVKHLCFELSMVSSTGPFAEVGAALEKLRGAKIVSVSMLDFVGGWPVIDVHTSITVQSAGELGAESLGALEQSIVLSWREGTGCVGEQERYEIEGPRHPVSVSVL